MSDYSIALVGLVLLVTDVRVEDVNLFYHEPSQRIINSPLRKRSQFGFSMTYQPESNTSSSLEEKLVVGAPRGDVDGQIYTCTLNDILFSQNHTCTKVPIDLKNTRKPGKRPISPTQEFWLGASLAATSEYVFVCAPLWSDDLHKKIKKRVYNFGYGSYGRCYVLDGGPSLRNFNGLYEKASKIHDSESLMGGFGWSMLIDENLGHWIIGKPALQGSYLSYANLAEANRDDFGLSGIPKPIEVDYEHFGNAFAVGNYFSDLNGTVLAISATRFLKGTILFAQYSNTKDGNGYAIVPSSASAPRNLHLELQDGAVGAMFGEALCAVDLTGDGHEELAVGAPAHSEGARRADVGAVHLYLGGSRESIKRPESKLTIFGVQEGGYFGRAITSVGDLDSDGFFDICVGAPYEDGGAGAVYVLSGRELGHMLLKEIPRATNLNKLKSVQRLKSSNTRAFGFSLLPLPDIDRNGCNELVVGAPDSDPLTFYRCNPSIKVDITLELQKFDKVPENVTAFEIKVCYVITYPMKPKTITNKLLVTNYIKGNGVKIKKNINYFIEIWTRPASHCEEIPIQVSNSYPGYYNFSSSYTLSPDPTHVKDFDTNWVKIYPKSSTEQTLKVIRGCSTQECTPRLTANLTSSIGEGNVTYILGATYHEEVTLNITNEGDSAYKACVRIIVDGPKARIDCKREEIHSGYTCYLPRPFVRHAKFPIRMQLDMATLTNKNKKIGVVVVLDKNCDGEEVTQRALSYDVKQNIKNITVESFNNEWVVTINDTDVNKTIDFEHVYFITNNDSYWGQLQVTLDLKKEKYVRHSKVLRISDDFTKCTTKDIAEQVSFQCDNVKINPESFIKVSLQLFLITNEATEYIDNGFLNITSYLTVQLSPTEPELHKSVSHVFRLRKANLRFDQKKNVVLLLFIFMGLLLLIIVMVILYKCGFFKRMHKKKLQDLKDEIRRESIRRSQRRPAPEDGSEGNNQAQPCETGQDTSFIETFDCTVHDTQQLVAKDEKEENGIL